MNISNRLARLIREGKPTVGMWMNLCDPGVAQIGAGAGYDWIMIDIEHNPLTESQVQGLLHALTVTVEEYLLPSRVNHIAVFSVEGLIQLPPHYRRDQHRLL